MIWIWWQKLHLILLIIFPKSNQTFQFSHRDAAGRADLHPPVHAEEAGVPHRAWGLLLHWDCPHLHQHPPHCCVVSQLCQSQKDKLSQTKKSIRDLCWKLWVCIVCKHIITSIILEKAVTMTIIFVEIESPTCSGKNLVFSGIEWTNLKKRKARISSCSVTQWEKLKSQ